MLERATPATSGARELLTVPEAAAEARVSRWTVYRLIERGAVPAVRVGDGGSGAVRVPAQEFRAWLFGAPEDAA